MTGEKALRVENARLMLSGEVTRATVPGLFDAYRSRTRGRVEVIDIAEVSEIDNSGVAFLEYVRDTTGGEVRYEGARASVAHMLELFGS
ncbi:MAG: STAS domain-containing protein, partial [Spirochaetota bacterium]